MRYEEKVLHAFQLAMHYGQSECIGVEPTEKHMEHHDPEDLLFGSPHGRAIALVIERASRLVENPSASNLDALEGSVTRLGLGTYLEYEKLVGKAHNDKILS